MTSVLAVVQVDLSFSTLDHPGDRGEVGILAGDDAGDELGEETRLLVGALPGQRQEDVEPCRATGLGEAVEPETVPEASEEHNHSTHEHN